MKKTTLLHLFLICLIHLVLADNVRADPPSCTTTAAGPLFSPWGGGTWLKIIVQCDGPTTTIQITGGEWDVDYDDPRYTDASASGFSKTCNNVARCELSMNIGYPYSVPGRTSVTTWSGNSSYPSGNSFATATYDPYP